MPAFPCVLVTKMLYPVRHSVDSERVKFPAFYKAVNWYLVAAGIVLMIYQLYNYLVGAH